jgi:DNA-binding MarR family transcriptional regulator
VSSGAEGASELLGRELSTAVVMYHQAIASHLGLSATEWKCLDVLGRHGPMTAGRLAELSGLTTGAITSVVDRLERTGYARREPNPADRRSVIVVPLRQQEIAEQVAPIFAALGAAMGELAGRFSEQELRAIQAFFDGTIEILREQTKRVRASTFTGRETDRDA